MEANEIVWTKNKTIRVYSAKLAYEASMKDTKE